MKNLYNEKEISVFLKLVSMEDKYIIKLLICFGIFLLQSCQDKKNSTLQTEFSDKWNPVAYQILIPEKGVTLDTGLFKMMFEKNISYLLHSFSVDQMLRPFRLRAGVKEPSGEQVGKNVWTSLPGSMGGRFLMGAGNTLCWVVNDSLRREMDELVKGIDACKEPDGYIMAYPKNKFTYSEYGNYVRSWLTQGLLAAGKAGNKNAYKLIRNYYDWFDTCQFLPIARNLRLGYQGMIPNTLMYFSPVGKPEDIKVLQKYYEEDWWLNQLSERNPNAVWNRPRHTPHTHCYELVALMAYLDMYRATGNIRYLNAVLGGWQLYHDNWTHLGGSISISEGPQYPPKSYYLHEETGETCCSAFWIRLNQRLHLLYPEKEKYINEIEQTIYNVMLANQDGAKGVRYHADLDSHKEEAQCNNTCCEGQATQFYGALPEFIFSKAGDGGIYVNLFTAATINWTVKGQNIALKMITKFPESDSVRLTIKMALSSRFQLHIRIPSWVNSNIKLMVNKEPEGEGKPGTYYCLDRKWKDRDVVSFRLPMNFRIVRYKGLDQIFSTSRYGVMYGPLLMAFTGPLNFAGTVGIQHSPKDFESWIAPVKRNDSLHFTIKDYQRDSCIPYWQVANQTFTCFPIIQDTLNF